MRISSEPNVGTTIALWLPIAKVAAPSAEGEVLSNVPASYVGTGTVLIVDDDSLVMTGISAMIEDLGHTPIEAHSGAEAVAKLASGIDIDVVITDHAMPAMTGLQLARYILERHPGLPVILATGYAEIPGDAVSLGIPRLAKPCNQYEIAMAIQSALASRRAVRRRRVGCD